MLPSGRIARRPWRETGRTAAAPAQEQTARAFVVTKCTELKKAAEFIVAFQRKKPEAIGAKARFPGFIEPALATSIEKVLSGSRWLHEIKFDGYRVQLAALAPRIWCPREITPDPHNVYGFPRAAPERVVEPIQPKRCR